MQEKASKKKKLHIAVLKQMLTLATAGFGLVAALAWNSAIQEFINTYIKQYLTVGSGVISVFFYAIFITVFAVLVTFYLTRLLEKLEED